jgi:ribonuclease D
MQFITNTADLTALCQKLISKQIITVDTEFMREKTYFPILCLIQVAWDDGVALIDPMADGIVLTPFFNVLQHPQTLKVFHGGKQDFEIFVQLTGQTPTPVMDTQIAAMVAGFGDQIGYEGLIKKLLGKQVDKSSRFTDWAIRPLSEKQLVYAAEDVTFLFEAWQKLKAILDKNHRHDWILDEMKTLAALDTYLVNKDEMWRKLKPPNVRPRTLAVLQAVCRWREAEAQKINIPRGRLMKDETVLQLAAQPPRSLDELAGVRQIPNGFTSSERGRALFEAIQKALSLKPEDCPKMADKIDLPQGISATADLLRVLLKHICEEHNVAPKLIASAHELDLLAAFGEKADLPLLKGWRYEVFGKTALELLKGRLMLSIKEGVLVLTTP